MRELTSLGIIYTYLHRIPIAEVCTNAAYDRICLSFKMPHGQEQEELDLLTFAQLIYEAANNATHTHLFHTPGKHIPVAEVFRHHNGGHVVLRFKKHSKNIYDEIMLDDILAMARHVCALAKAS